MPDSVDPFEIPRREAGVLSCPFKGETVRMILRQKDVRAAAKDWKTYSSDAPFRVPVPSEEDLRTVRQLPIETDPPEHTKYRKLVEPFFKRTGQPEIQEKIADLIERSMAAGLASESVEIVREFATVIQSRALTYLLNVPESEADEWITWGFSSLIDNDGNLTGDRLEAYLNRQLDRAYAEPGDDFFSVLTQATVDGRTLTRDEVLGFANLTFAGGRDTVIKTITTAMAHFAANPQDLQALRNDPKLINSAAEELFRYTTPLTHIGRVCPRETDVHGQKVQPGERISLGWASANRDPDVFEEPNAIMIDRRPNPHVAFGFGPHNCLGATHARVILRTLLTVLSERVGCMEIQESQEFVEREECYERSVSFEKLVLKMHPLG